MYLSKRCITIASHRSPSLALPGDVSGLADSVAEAVPRDLAPREAAEMAWGMGDQWIDIDILINNSGKLTCMYMYIYIYIRY